MTAFYGAMKVMAMEMYFMAALSGSPSVPCQSSFQPVPTIHQVRQVAVQRHILGLRRLKVLTDLSMTRLSEILNVDRRTPYFWEKGGNIDPDNEAHLETVLVVLASVGQVSADLMRRSILAIDQHGLSTADYLREHRYQEAGEQLNAAIANQGSSMLTMPFLGHRSLKQLLELEDGADQGVPPSSRTARQVRIPLKATSRRA